MEFNPNSEQEKVINHGKGTLLVEAGPGSGKTTVIVARIEELIKKGVNPETFLVITFTTKAADNLKNKLRKNLSNDTVSKMQISTIHSFCLEYLKSKNISLSLLDDDTSEKKTLFIQKFKKELGFINESTILDYQIPAVLNRFGEYTCFNVDSEELIKRIRDSRPISQDYLDFVKSMYYFSKKRIDDHDKIIKKNKDFEDEDLFSKSWYNARYLQIAKAYPKYLELLDEYNYVDYDTLQLKTLQELEKDPETNYKTILVDEFQDTDPLQFRIFEILRKNCDYFTAVGDVDQHIYAFRSSFNDFFDELVKLDEPDVLSLDTNYRSTEKIVKLTESFIAPQRKETSQKHMKSNNKRYNNPNFIIENDNSDDEAENIYQLIKYLKNKNLIKCYSDVAVLYRKHSDKTIANLKDKFNMDDEIDFTIRGQSDLAEQNEVKSLIMLLWYVARKTNYGYIPSTDELKELNLKAFSGEYFTPTFWSLDNSTITYLNDLQQSYYDEVLRIENENRKNKVRAVHNIKKNETQETLIEIFKKVKMPEIDLNMIENEEDKIFFTKLEEIREKIKLEEPPTILEVYYELISLGEIFKDVEKNNDEIVNLATLTQTLYNYESFISKTDVRGALYFLTSMVKNYASYHEETKDGVQLMTIHAAKGLEFPVTIITSLQKDKFPMISKDPTREKDYVFPNDTYYTPNDCLKYKSILKQENGELIHKNITVEEENQLDSEEEDRILYVAMTRAADLLILSTIGESPEQIDWIRDYLTPFSYEKLDNVEICKHFEPQKDEKLKLNYSSYSTYNLCPFLYNLVYNQGFRVSSEDVTNLGTVFHEVMEQVNLKLIDNQKPSKNEIIKLTREVYSSMFDMTETTEEYTRLEENILNYYETYSKNLNVLESELPFEIERENYILNGAIDLIYKLNDDEIAILDYKNSEHDDYKIAHYEKQLYIYASALKELSQFNDYEIKTGITHFVKTDYRNEVEITQDAIDNQLNKLNDVAIKIDKKKEYPKHESNFCKVCKFKLICGN